MIEKQCKNAPLCSRRKKWQSRYKSYKKGLNTKIYLIVDAHEMLVKIIITEGSAHDNTSGKQCNKMLVRGLFFVDTFYDSDAIISQAKSQGISTVIPTKTNRKCKREFDRHFQN
jgi:transposase